MTTMSQEEFKLDLTVFENTNITLPYTDHMIKGCIYTKRLLTALSYYSHLNVEANTNNQLIFIEFMDKIYNHQIFDDFHHLTQDHQSELKAIANLAIECYKLTTCDLSTCHYADRHYRTRQSHMQLKSRDDTKYLNVYTEIMDSLHFHVFHLIEGGMRLQVIPEPFDTTSSTADQLQYDKTSPYFDPEFAGMTRALKKSGDKTDRFPRLKNKFNISNDNINGSKSSVTFLDSIYKHLLTLTSINNEIIMQLMTIIESFDYDTDSVDIDLGIFAEYGASNISLELNMDRAIHEMVQAFIKAKSYVYKYTIWPTHH